MTFALLWAGNADLRQPCIAGGVTPYAFGVSMPSGLFAPCPADGRFVAFAANGTMHGGSVLWLALDAPLNWLLMYFLHGAILILYACWCSAGGFCLVASLTPAFYPAQAAFMDHSNLPSPDIPTAVRSNVWVVRIINIREDGGGFAVVANSPKLTW